MKHPFAKLIGLVFESVEEGKSLCIIDINENLFNPQNVVHGGVLYSMADTGMGGALYPLLKDDEYCATIEIKISYFKPVLEGVSGRIVLIFFASLSPVRLGIVMSVITRSKLNGAALKASKVSVLLLRTLTV